MARVFTQARWTQLLRREKGVFSTVELERMTGLSAGALRKAIRRQTELGMLLRLRKGLYANGLRAPRVEEVASIIYPPAYISCESALFMHGVVDQAPYVLTCITTNKTRTLHTDLGEIAYFHVKKELFFGYQVMDRTFVALPEKAALDYVYLQRQNGFAPALDEWNWEHLRADKLAAMLPAYPKTVARHLMEFAPEGWLKALK
jgi:predicted transcriptional regulator of viral defense system